MDFKLATPFLEAFEELNKIDESLTSIRCMCALYEDDDGYVCKTGVYAGSLDEEEMEELLTEKGMCYVQCWGEYFREESVVPELGDVVEVFHVEEEDIEEVAAIAGKDPEEYEQIGFFEDLSEGITEATDKYASYNFWDWAKSNKISTYWFHEAFDEELTELGLMDIFNKEGMLKDKGTWGKIKNALETNPDSWAVKAVKKMWVLQFKEGVTKSIEQIDREREEAERAKRQAERDARDEQDRLDREAKYAAAKEAWGILNEKLPSIQKLVDTVTSEFAAEKKATLIKDLEAAVKLETEIEADTKGIVESRNSSARTHLARLKSGTYTIKVSTKLNALDKRFPSARIFVKVQELFGERPYFMTGSDQVLEYTSFTVDDIDEENVRAEVLSLLNKIWEIVNSKLNSLSDAQRQHDTVMTKVNTAKTAQAAADAGQPVDPKFISDLLAVFDKGKHDAKKAYDFYSDTTDGSAGAAEAMATYDTLIAAGTYLVNCNWRAVVGDKEIAAWRTTGSVDDLYDELHKVFRSFSPKLTIEIVKA